MPGGERVLVIGATRGTGLLIARRLLESGYRLRVLARDSGRARELFGESAEVVEGDVTRPETLPPAVTGMDHIVYTAAARGRPAREELVKATVYEGVLSTLEAVRRAGLPGRFLLMGALGTTRGSLLSLLLNLVKGNTLRWRRRAEEAVRRSGVDYTIIHAGILVDAPAGARAVRIGQSHLPLLPRYRIGRADVAEVFVRALRHPGARNSTFDAVWGRDGSDRGWEAMLGDLRPDDDSDPPLAPRQR